jgi:hypothetical protein
VWAEAVLGVPVRFGGKDGPRPARSELLGRALAGCLEDEVYRRILPLAAEMP